MFNGAFALLERSLRVDSRAWPPHLARLGLIGAIYISVCFSLYTSSMIGAPGLLFFRSIAYLEVTFMTLLGIGFFSTSITEEKEEDTLGLMLMAGISPLGILAGKSGGRLWQSLLLVGVQFPFVLLAVTMGGILPLQVWAVMVGLLAYIVLIAGFGLLCSTLAPRSQSASAWMVIGLSIYFMVPFVANEMSANHAKWLLAGGSRQWVAWWTVVGWIGEVCVAWRMGDILTTGFGESVLSFQVISNATLGLFCAGLAWLWFDVAVQNLSTESNSRGLVTRIRQSPLFSPGRLRSNPFIWKDFYFVAGGIPAVVVRIIYFGMIGNIVLWTERQMELKMLSRGWHDFSAFVMWFSVAIDAGRVLSRSLQDELRSQTLASLIMLPHTPTFTIYSKFAGAMLGWLPSPIIAVIILLNSTEMRKGFADIQRETSLLLVMVFLLFSLIPHFAALVSLYVRWGAVPLAIGLTIATYFCLGVFIWMIQTVFQVQYQRNSQLAIFGILSFFEFLLCLLCHIGVLLRVQKLAEQ